MIQFLVGTLALLLCNAVYCAIKTFSDFKRSEPSVGILGLVALAGAILPLVTITWALLASIAHY